MTGVQLWMGAARYPIAVPGDADTKLIYDVSTSSLSKGMRSFRAKRGGEKGRHGISTRSSRQAPQVVINEDYLNPKP